MTDAQKYQGYRVGSVAAIVAAAFVLSRLSPWATPHYNKVRFVWLMAIVLAGLWCSVAAIYYRSKVRNPMVNSTAVDTLAAAGSQMRQKDRPN